MAVVAEFQVLRSSPAGRNVRAVVDIVAIDDECRRRDVRQMVSDIALRTIFVRCSYRVLGSLVDGAGWLPTR